MPKNLKIPAQLLPPVGKKNISNLMSGLRVKSPLTIRKPKDVTQDINKQLTNINKKMKGKKANVTDVMRKLQNLDIKMTEQKTDKKGGKTRRKRKKRKRKENVNVRARSGLAVLAAGVPSPPSL